MRAFAKSLPAAALAAAFLAATSSVLPAQEAKTVPPAEIAKLAEAEAAKVFNDAYKAKIQAEALAKYPDIKVGDKITVPVRAGANSMEKTGILRAVGDDAIMVNLGAASDKKILKVDLHPDLRAAIEGENAERRSGYFVKCYTQARAGFKKSSLDRLYHENGYVFDAELSRWTPKLKESLPESKPAEAAEASHEDSLTKEIATRNGEIYRDVKIQRVTQDGVEILHSSGAATLKFEELPESLRKSLETSNAAHKVSQDSADKASQTQAPDAPAKAASEASGQGKQID